MDGFMEANRRNWNERTALHLASPAYDLEGFLAGETGGIPEDEQSEVGPVEGKRLLHLQCHFGKDTLAWARLGARVTGVDIADEAVEVARSLAARCGLAAEFISADVLDLPNVMAGEFDVVYASWGVLVWIPNVERWAAVAAHFLAPGGVFYLAEGHPLLWAFDDDKPDIDPGESYFGNSEPTRFEQHGSYTGEQVKFSHPVTYQWQHTMGEIVTAVARAGLRIEFLHERPWAAYQRFQGMTRREDGRWHLPHDRLPLNFSLRATKPART